MLQLGFKELTISTGQSIMQLKSPNTEATSPKAKDIVVIMEYIL